jgi:hypothetical protein
MRSLRITLAVFAALLAFVGCKSEPNPAESLKDDAPAAAAAPAGGAAAPAAGQLPPGVQAKDVPGMGAPPPAGSPEASGAGASKITQ